MKSPVTTLYWFTCDQRLHDNEALLAAARGSDFLICIYLHEPWVRKHGLWGYEGAANQRIEFLGQSLTTLAKSLTEVGQKLLELEGDPESTLGAIIEKFSVANVIRSVQPGSYEQRAWAKLQSQHPNVVFEEHHTRSLFTTDQLPFAVTDLPPTFTKFRKQVEKFDITSPLAKPATLPPPPSALVELSKNKPGSETSSNLALPVLGGENNALARVVNYFSSDLPHSYKQVRNSLDGFDNSTKFSFWLANGNLSPRLIINALNRFEQSQGANESSYWIYFELLWREFFHWHALQHGARLFSFSGIQQRRALGSYYPERFRKWAAGNTPYPLVNAIMKELLATGYISNRARQISASCLVNELAIDWRYGARWFEQHLVDYDVASNWGNWQYLAGVGADVQAKRHFNLQKQQAQFDPNGSYIRHWCGEQTPLPLDSVDAADWPI